MERSFSAVARSASCRADRPEIRRVKCVEKTSVAAFLKSPRPGRVKTRLARRLGAEAAASLYRSFLRDTLEWLARFPARRRFLYYSPAGAARECARLAPGEAFELRPQSTGSLGRRLERAFEELLDDGSRVVVLGTDCPLLGSAELRLAFDALRQSDLVLGPAFDGGYYLIGLRRAQPELLRGIPWSTPDVLRATLERATDLGLSWAQLAPLGDVDTVGDLRRLQREILEAWEQVARGERRDFPLRTFRELTWRLAAGVERKA